MRSVVLRYPIPCSTRVPKTRKPSTSGRHVLALLLLTAAACLLPCAHGREVDSVPKGDELTAARASTKGGVSAVASSKQWYILMYGEESDMDLDPRGDVIAIKEAGFPSPVLWWNPSAAKILTIPRTSPILFVGHTTDETFKMFANMSYDPTDNVDYQPTPPLDPAAGWKPGDMFLWGWPEPFKWVNVTTPWHPARTKTQALYPFRYHHLVIVGSCFGRKFEHEAFPNVRGLFDKAAVVDEDEEGVPLPLGRVKAMLKWYAEHTRKRRSPTAFLKVFDKKRHLLSRYDEVY